MASPEPAACSGDPGPAEPHRVIGDDQLVRPGGRDEPALKRYAIQSREGDVLVVRVLDGTRKFIEKLPVSQDDKEKIAHLNAEKLFSL